MQFNLSFFSGVKVVDGRMSRSLVEGSTNDPQHYIIYRQDRDRMKYGREFGKVIH